MSGMRDPARFAGVPFETLVDLVRLRARRQPDAVAFGEWQVDGRHLELTYGRLDAAARSLAARIQPRLERGDRVLLVFSAGLDFVVAFCACLYAGAVAVPTAPQRLEEDRTALEALVGDSGARLALVAGPLAEKARRALGQSQCLAEVAVETVAAPGTEEEAGGSEAVAPSWEAPAIDGGSMAVLQYTSGSTASPRGCVLTHANLLANSAAIQAKLGLDDTSRAVVWTPPYHDMGLVGGLLQPLFAGFPVLLMSPVAFVQRPVRWLRAISSFRATISCGPTFGYELCVSRIPPEQRAGLDLRSWAVAVVGAEQVRSATLDRFADAFGPCGFRRSAFRPCYGLAEATLLVSGAQAPTVKWVERDGLQHGRVTPAAAGDPAARPIVSCGAPAAGTRVVVVDVASGRRPGADGVGEIWVQGPGVAGGYWNKPQDTARVFGARLSPSGEGPFLRTGDVGFEQGGEIFVTGRLKDLIILHGQNHDPQDIEETAQQAHPCLRVGSGAAFSVQADDGEQVFLVQEADRAALRAVNPHEVVEAVRTAVFRRHHLHLRDVVLVRPGTLPRTTSGKVQRNRCWQVLRAAAPEAAPPVSGSGAP